MDTGPTGEQSVLAGSTTSNESHDSSVTSYANTKSTGNDLNGLYTIEEKENEGLSDLTSNG